MSVPATDGRPRELVRRNKRLMRMRQRMLIAVLVAMVAAACGDPSPHDLPSGTASAELMATALRHLVTEDHTFGQGPPPFTEFLIEERTVDNSAAISPEEGDDDAAVESRPLTDQERTAVEDAIAAYGPVRWVADPDEWRTDDLQPEIEGSVILGVGIPQLDGDDALVPVSLWCGGTCGTWLTYRLQVGEDGVWRVVGTEGPIAIS